MTECAALWIALVIVGFWALGATLHLIDAKAEIKRLNSLSTHGAKS